MIQAVSVQSPRLQAKCQGILDGALLVFSEVGYAGASMVAIAIAAQVSKPTLYVHFGAKEQLFEAIMSQAFEYMLEPFIQSAGDMVEGLNSSSWHFVSTVMQPRDLSLARLMIGEAQRFPEIDRADHAAGPDRTLAGVMAYLSEMRGEGRLVFEDAELAAQDFWALILSAPRNQALHIPDPPPDRPAIRRYLENGVRVFLKACSPWPKEDLARLAAIIAKHHKSMENVHDRQAHRSLPERQAEPLRNSGHDRHQRLAAGADGQRGQPSKHSRVRHGHGAADAGARSHRRNA